MLATKRATGTDKQLSCFLLQISASRYLFRAAGVCGPSRDCSAGWLIVVCQLRYPSHTGQRPDGPIVLVFCPIMKVLFWLPYPLQRQGPQGRWFVREHTIPSCGKSHFSYWALLALLVGLACCTPASAILLASRTKTPQHYNANEILHCTVAPAVEVQAHIRRSPIAPS